MRLKPDSASKPKVKAVRPSVARPAPANRNRSQSQKPDFAKSKGQRYHGPNNPLVTQFDDRFKQARGHSLRQYANMPKALLDSGVASAAEIRSVLNARAQRPDKRNPDPRIQAEALKLKIAERQQPKTKNHDDGFLGLRFDVGDAVQSWRDLLTPTGGETTKGDPTVDMSPEAQLARKGFVQEEGLRPDVIAEAVLGGGFGGLGALGVKALAGQAATRAAGGMLTANALKAANPALRYTVPVRGPLKHVVANRPSVMRPIADFAARGPAQRIAAGSSILAASPAAEKLAQKGAEVGGKIKGGAAIIEVDPSELNPVGQAYAAGRKPTQKEIDLSGFQKGPGRLGLSRTLRKRLLHQARVNGWPIPDSVNDTELIAKAYKRNATIEQRLTAGLVENASNLAFVPAFAGAAYDASQRTATGEGAKPWLQIAEGMANATVNAAKHPIDNPLFAAGIYNAGIRGVGRGSAKVLRVKEQPLSFQHGEVAGQPYTYRYGTAAPNTLTRPAALLGQKLLNSPRAAGIRNTIMASQGARAGSVIATRASNTGAAATRDLTKALSKLGKKEQVLAVWSHLTGSSAKNQAAYYQQRYESAMRRKEGYTNSKGKEIAPRKVNEVNLRALKAKAHEWERLAHLEANLTPSTRAKIQRFGDEAKKVEAVNQQIMGEAGLTPEGMKERLWMQALEQHPDVRARVADALDTRRAANAVVPKPGRLQKGEKATITGDVRQQVQQEMQAAGVEPKMWVPHTPLDSGPAGFITASNPWLTSVADRMKARMQQNKGVTLRTGQIDERPSLAISAAAKPSAIASATHDVEQFINQVGVKLDVTKDRGQRVDGREFVYVKTTRDGKLDRGAIMRRAHDQASMLEQRGLADTATVDDLMGLIFDTVEPKMTTAGHEVIPKGTYYVVPRAIHERWLENAKREAIQRGLTPTLRKVARTTTGLMINTLPRTIVNNAGGVAMSTMGGAGPIAHARYLSNPEARALVPKELVGRGTSGSQTRNVAAKEGSLLLRPIRSHQNRMRRYNVAVEDFPRGALAVNNLLKEAKQIQHGGSIRASMHRVNTETYNIAKGLYDTHPDKYAKAIKKTVDWVGDLGHLSRLDPGFQIAAPFWRWNAHILKATLYTMPKKYPLRLTLLEAMGEVGREYQREHGIWPSWLQGAIDLGDEIPILGGIPGTITSALTTQGAWPYATQSGVLTSGFDNTGYDPVGALANLGPVATLPPALFGIDAQRMQRFKDAKGEPIPFGSPEWRKLLLSTAIQELPTPYSRSGQTATSVPWDPTYKNTGLPRRSNDALSLLMRSFGFGVTPVVTGGPDLKAQSKKAFKRAKTSFSKLSIEERRAMAKAWRARWGDEVVPNHPGIDHP